MQAQNRNIEMIFKVVNKRPQLNKQEQLRRKETVRADLYQVYKKYV